MDFEKELQHVAESYRGQGYRVVVRPGPNELPPFARDFKVELLCRRGNDGVLVAIKQNRDAVSADPDMQTYAEITSSQPGWRFDFAILEPENPKAREIRGAMEFSDADIARSLDEAGRLGSQGFSRSAVIEAWAAIEAAMRMRLRAAGREAGWGSAPRQMSRELFSAGLLSPEEFREIELAMQIRNQIVHGFLTSSPQPETTQMEIARSLAEIARKLVRDSRASPQAASA